MTALYNKYRPKSFQDLVGQDHIVKPLQTQLKNDTLPNFLIFCGPTGSGKTSLARIVGKELNPNPGGVLERDSTSHGCKEKIKELQTDVLNKPLLGKYKIYIFEEAQEITSSGFSALLKITEEPPDNVYFFFTTTELYSIPQTIRGRAQVHNFLPIEDQVILTEIDKILLKENKTIPEKYLTEILSCSKGSLRGALVALNSLLTGLQSSTEEDLDIGIILGVVGNHRLNKLVLACMEQDFSSLNDIITLFYSEKISVQSCVYDIQEFVIDLKIILTREGNFSSRFDFSEINICLNNLKMKFAKEEHRYKVVVANCITLLDLILNKSIELDRNLKISSNKKAMLTKFAVELADGW